MVILRSKKRIRDKIVRWYNKHGRSFPWRQKNRKLYEILIAEILLRKTRAEKVETLYLQFLEHFPDFKALNEAKKEEIAKSIWQLGLQNRRAKTLKQVSEHFLKGKKPPIEKIKALEKIPGIGRYTVNATLCFVFEKRVPLVDANIARILERFYGFEHKENDLSNREKLWKVMNSLLPQEGVKKFNYALIDIGSLICSPQDPDCQSCPLSIFCKEIRE